MNNTIGNPVRQMLYQARRRAKQKGLPINIEETDIVIPERCPVLGIPLEIAKCVSTANSPTLDRIDNTRGYEKGNVLVVSQLANSMKQNLSLDQIEAMARGYERQALNWRKMADFYKKRAGE